MTQTFSVIAQKWEESEAGWGTRPDGWTMHLDAEAHKAYVKSHADRQKAFFDERGITEPHEYTRTDGSAYAMEVDEETYRKIEASPEKTIWGKGNGPPVGKQGTDGWRTLPR